MRCLLRIVVRFGVALLCVAQTAFAFAVEPAAGILAPHIAASLSPIANFAYQLDCISGWVRSCGGRDDYTRLWQQQFGVDAAHSAEVVAWRRAFSGSQDLLVRARIASFESTSIEDYLRKIDTLFARDRATEIRAVVRAHYPAFEQWWNDASRADRDSRATALQRALESPPLVGELPNLYRFFAVPADSSRELRLALLYRPGEAVPQQTTGEFLGDDWSVAEFAPSDVIANRLGVILHEYTHYVFAKMAPTDRDALRGAVVANSDHGAAAWSLFNESVATAVGNGRTFRMLAADADWQPYYRRDQSFYLDAAIDASAKAILPLIDSMLDGSESVKSPAFTSGYYGALTAHLGDLWQSPTLVLGEFKALADDRFNKSIFDFAFREFHAHSVWFDTKPCCGAEFEQWWKDNADLTRVVAIHKNNATTSPRLDAKVAKDFAALGEGTPGYTIAHRGALADIVIVGDTVSSMEAAFRAIAQMRALEDGVYAVSSQKGLSPWTPTQAH